MKSNIRRPTAFTHEGAPSPILYPERALRRSVMSNMLFENEFYEDGQKIAERIKNLCSQVSFDTLASCAIDARERFKLRHIPLLLLREALRYHKGKKVGALIARVIQRPDEMGELFALYRKDGGKGEPAQLKQGIAQAFSKFSEYQLAKYNRDGEFKLRDIMFLCHVKPRTMSTEEIASAQNFDEPTVNYGVELAPAINKKGYKRGPVYRHSIGPGLILKKVAENTLATPDTWEVNLSSGADKKETFERLISENKLGALALLRNLRKMLEVGVSEDLIRSGLARMRSERVLPFRFISAAKYAPRLEDTIEEAMFKCLSGIEKIGGKTALMVDHSTSMDQKVSEKSEVTRFEAAAALALILREVTERVRVFTFSNCLVEIAPRRGFGMLAALNSARKPAGTLLGSAVRAMYRHFPECDRTIVITDEQSADRPGHPQGKGYIINVASNAQGIGYGPWTTIDGWSEAVIDFIREFEKEDD